MTSLTIARQLHALGLSVIPVPGPRPGCPSGQPGDGKVPTLRWRDYQSRLPTDEELVAWFADDEPMNVAVVTGAISGVVVIDADTAEALRWCTRRLRYTPWQTKTARGFHLWYRHPGVLVPNRSKLATPIGTLAIDLRADGGYVIAPGSVHASGLRYAWAGDWTAPREDVPVFWPGWLARPTRGPSPRPARTRPSGPVIDRARRYLAAIPPPVIGQGSDVAVLRAACRLIRGFELSVDDAATLLWEWAGGRPGWTFEWVAAKCANAARYGTEPIGALR